MASLLSYWLEIKVCGSPKFMEFYGALPRSSDLYKEIDNVLDLLKEDPLGVNSTSSVIVLVFH